MIAGFVIGIGVSVVVLLVFLWWYMRVSAWTDWEEQRGGGE